LCAAATKPMQADPVAAARRRKRERFGRIVGCSLGLLFGTTGLVIGLWMSR
jgi:hypothetical protein